MPLGIDYGQPMRYAGQALGSGLAAIGQGARQNQMHGFAIKDIMREDFKRKRMAEIAKNSVDPQTGKFDNSAFISAVKQEFPQTGFELERQAAASKGSTVGPKGIVYFDENRRPKLASTDINKPFVYDMTSAGGKEASARTQGSDWVLTEDQGVEYFTNRISGEKRKVGEPLATSMKKAANKRAWSQLWMQIEDSKRESEKWGIKKAERDEKKRKRIEGIALAAQTVVEDLGRGIHVLDKNRKKLITTAAGPLAVIARQLPATDADVLEKYATSVKSNISIDRLQAMREASPTGGALGQIPVQQQEYLMQLLGSLDTAQKPPILEDNMKRIYNIYMDIIHGYGNGPKNGFRYKLSFDELGRPVKGGRKWKGTEYDQFLDSRAFPENPAPAPGAAPAGNNDPLGIR